MKNAVLISIRPEWVKKILNGEKTLEIRKTEPKINTPFKCYIYCTLGGEVISYNDYCGYDMQDFREDFISNGKVVAEFTCDNIHCILAEEFIIREDAENALKGSLLSITKAKEYAGWKPGSYRADCKPLYGWHISDLKVYEKRKELRDFAQCHKCEFHAACKDHEYSCNGEHILKRPPQSWVYVEEVL